MQNNLGRWGEKVARWYLEKEGYEFIEANYRTRYGEIDLIMRLDGRIVFIEVKTRRVGNRSTGNKSLPYSKLKRLEASIAEYNMLNNIEDWKLILVSITKSKDKVSIKITNV